MTNLRFPNNYFKQRYKKNRFRLDQHFLNQIQDYIYNSLKPSLTGLVRARTAKANPEYFKGRYSNLQTQMEKAVMEFSIEHFEDIIRLSLFEKYRSWHKIPKEEVDRMLELLLDKSKFSRKIKYYVNKTFDTIKPKFSPKLKEFKEKNFVKDTMEEIQDMMNRNTGSFSSVVYTHSTYFVNSAYEIQFRQRDPKDLFLYRWGTRPDNRRTPQCAMIDQLVKKQMKITKEEGVKIDWLKTTVDRVANMRGFKKANPDIPWVPHYGCRSGLERVV